MQPSQNYGNYQKPKVVFTTNPSQSQNSNQIPVQQVPPVSVPMYSQVQYQMPPYQQQQIIYPSQVPLQMPGLSSYNNYSIPNQFYSPNEFQPVASINLLNKTEDDKNKKVVAVIVTFFDNCSYDSLFTTVQQKSQEGTKVLVYSCTSNAIDLIAKQFKGQDSKNPEAKQLVKNVKQLDPDCVVFNWECSSGYSFHTFPQGKDLLFKFVRSMIDRGHMVMFSDFSLKALIQQWDSHLLGPNPFKNVGQTSTPIQLYFDSKILTDCPSAQLQIVGEMADGGRCHVETMGGTIVYSVDKTIKKNDFYTLQVLTVSQSDFQCTQQKYTLEVQGKKGTAGHVLLTYKSGGHLITSMGHWIQLMKIDTSQKKLFQIAQKQYGASYAAQMRSQYAQMDINQQQAYISSNAVNFVQNQAPCKNMASKYM